jgi:RNA polymerase sigma-B factor
MEDVTACAPATGRAVDRTEQRAETMRTLCRMRELPTDDPLRTVLRDRVVADHMDYARHVARRYARRGDGSREDIEQVAYLGLVKAVDGFDPEYGTAFLGYATPMIVGEIKRHYRDTTWAVHVPRRMQELTGALHQANDALTGELGHPPTIAQLAERLGTTHDEIVEALDASDAYRASSLDRPVGREQESASLGELIGAEDPGYELAIDREVLRRLIAKLGERDKRVLLMRFFRGMTQAEIGAELGLSQMHVSRLIAKVLAELRTGFE